MRDSCMPRGSWREEETWNIEREAREAERAREQHVRLAMARATDKEVLEEFMSRFDRRERPEVSSSDLRAKRQVMGLSITDVARAVDCSDLLVIAVELDFHGMAVDEIRARIAEALGVDPGGS